jgi:hypothetical protein
VQQLLQQQVPVLPAEQHQQEDDDVDQVGVVQGDQTERILAYWAIVFAG